MSAQTSYKFFTVKGDAGGIYDLAPYEVNAFANESDDGVMQYGMGVVVGTNSKKVKVPTATNQVFEGIVTNRRTNEHAFEGGVTFRKNSSVGVLRYGRINVAVADNLTINYNDPVYLICTGDNAGLFTNVASTNKAINARFIGSADNGICAVEVLQPNVVDATGSYTLPNASSSVLGGIKVGTGLAIDENGVLSVSN